MKNILLPCSKSREKFSERPQSVRKKIFMHIGLSSNFFQESGHLFEKFSLQMGSLLVIPSLQINERGGDLFSKK